MQTPSITTPLPKGTRKQIKESSLSAKQAQAYLLKTSGQTTNELAELFHVSRQTIRLWINTAKERGYGLALDNTKLEQRIREIGSGAVDVIGEDIIINRNATTALSVLKGVGVLRDNKHIETTVFNVNEAMRTLAELEREERTLAGEVEGVETVTPTPDSRTATGTIEVPGDRVDCDTQHDSGTDEVDAPAEDELVGGEVEVDGLERGQSGVCLVGKGKEKEKEDGRCGRRAARKGRLWRERVESGVIKTPRLVKLLEDEKRAKERKRDG